MIKIKSGTLMKSYENDGGFDIIVDKDYEIAPNETLVIDTDISFSEIKKGYCIEILGRSSSVFKSHLFIPSTIIDANYTGCISYAVVNSSNTTRKICAGDRVAQLVIVKIEDKIIEDGGQIIIKNPGKIRGDNRVGSSGK